MKKNQNKIYSTAIFCVAILSILLLFFSFNFPPSLSATTESSTVSNVTVATTIGFTFSTNLSGGITYGELNPDTTDNNATGDTTNGGNTSYYITLDSGNNAGSDTCIKANAELTLGGSTIPNTGYTYDANSTINGANMNSATGSTAITTSYAKFGTENLAADDAQYVQFYLDIPSGQTAGTYNNTINFKIVETGGSC